MSNKFEDISLSVLGSTGSIGKQTIDVAENLGIKITALCANSNIELLEEQVRKFNPRFCAVYNDKAAKDLKVRVSDTSTKVLTGLDGILELCYEDKSNILLNSLSGSVGVKPTLCAIESGKNIAMANKEPIVAAGKIILKAAKDKNVSLIPVDSEHSAIFQCISGNFNSDRFVRRLILTASGGPFYGKKRHELVDITPEEAIKHPTWNMGKKISVDSATLMNKALELIEAVRLFNVPQENVDITVHRQSIVHSMVEFCDNSVLAQMGYPNMRHCIHFALTYPDRADDKGLCKPLDFKEAFKLTFDPVDEETFSLIGLARKAVSKDNGGCAVMNAANEEAVALFLDKKIGFTDIFDFVEETYEMSGDVDITSVDELDEIEDSARRFVRKLAASKKN
ncbi:MAG: 1-deoxy-D-xylulose-5-phosphate reductoisomerase [Ruminococcaceae bacterium]|nr:1-deoxy-D-xylulose-5-phosphate reductoisomerase [Oscillospiraceae bacterium]